MGKTRPEDQALPGLNIVRVQQKRSFALWLEDGVMEDLDARKLDQILPDREGATGSHRHLWCALPHSYAQPFLDQKFPGNWRPVLFFKDLGCAESRRIPHFCRISAPQAHPKFLEEFFHFQRILAD